MTDCADPPAKTAAVRGLRPSNRKTVLRRARKSIRSWIEERKGVGVKNFAGTLWDRLRGLEYLFEHAQSASVLDITSCEGLISYEFARHGASLVHGFERDGKRVLFSRRLFRDVPIESRFERTDLAVSGAEFVNRFQQVLLPRYDIVLFLGAYHHLRKTTSEAVIDSLVTELIRRTGRYFALRTGTYQHPEELILRQGFKLVHAPVYEDQRSGPLRIYERQESES